jgi:hypothetical protein
MVKTPESKAWASPAKIGRDQEDSSTGAHLGQLRGSIEPDGGGSPFGKKCGRIRRIFWRQGVARAECVVKPTFHDLKIGRRRKIWAAD